MTNQQPPQRPQPQWNPNGAPQQPHPPQPQWDPNGASQQPPPPQRPQPQWNPNGAPQQQHPPQSPQPRSNPNGAPQQNFTQPPSSRPYQPLPPKKKHVGRNLAIAGGVLLLGIVAIASQPSFSQGMQAGVDAARTPTPVVVSPAVQATPTAQVTTAAPATTAPTSTAPTTTAPAAPQVGPYGVYPAAEAAFIAETQAAITKYQAAKTDLQRSQVMRERNKNLLAIMGGTKVNNWVGIVKTVGANGEGKAYVSIEIAKGVSVKTWNNALSDAGDSTLIPTDSPFFQTLVSAAPGDKLAFSGSFFPDPDATIRTTNITETFSVLTPEFLVKFSAIAKQ